MRLATDIGGTFTDLVYLDDDTGRIGLAKASSTPPAFARGIMDALRKSGVPPGSVDRFVHGTTVVINALTERKGAVTALVTTEGCRDVLAIGRGNRPDIYNLRFRKQEPFVPRRRRHEVTERMNYKGEVVTPLDAATLDAVIEQLRADGVGAVAVSFLHSYAYPAHERQAAARIRAALPGVNVTASSDLTREWREYERTSTAVLNAYVQPVASAYLNELAGDLRAEGVACQLNAMKSNGGTQTFAVLAEQPIHLVESGPVGGVIGAAAIGAAIGVDDLITLDIGGTTAKCTLIDGGAIKITTEYRIERDERNAGYSIKAPVVDIVEIGAGGGSIAWIDQGGALKVGPKSAGAVPGPACYARGGTQPTVTDANLIAGRINPEYFLGGEIAVSLDAARAAMQPIADALGVTVDEAALGVIRIANANMINALKLVSVRRGYDPRDFALIAFGGGGPMHAAALAAELRVGKVIIPPAPGHFSAWGMLMTDPMQDFIQTAQTAAEDANTGKAEATFAALEREAAAFFEAAGADPAEVSIERFGDMRYAGQEHTVRVPFPGRLGSFADPVAAFHTLHERAYTFRLDSPTEILNYHVVARIPTVKPAIAPPEAAGSGKPKGRRMVDFDGEGRLEAVIWERADLPPGTAIPGPAVIEEPASTTVIHPGQRVTLDGMGNLIVELAG
ncbi:MAG: hydantoinase/oxoprolinase family protein [Chloroflexota bacterium]